MANCGGVFVFIENKCDKVLTNYLNVNIIKNTIEQMFGNMYKSYYFY